MIRIEESAEPRLTVSASALSEATAVGLHAGSADGRMTFRPVRTDRKVCLLLRWAFEEVGCRDRYIHHYYPRLRTLARYDCGVAVAEAAVGDDQLRRRIANTVCQDDFDRIRMEVFPEKKLRQNMLRPLIASFWAGWAVGIGAHHWVRGVSRSSLECIARYEALRQPHLLDHPEQVVDPELDLHEDC